MALNGDFRSKHYAKHPPFEPENQSSYSKSHKGEKKLTKTDLQKEIANISIYPWHDADYKKQTTASVQ